MWWARLLLWLVGLAVTAVVIPVEEEEPSFWNELADNAIRKASQLQYRNYLAKNLILFLGDGGWSFAFFHRAVEATWTPMSKVNSPLSAEGEGYDTIHLQSTTRSFRLHTHLHLSSDPEDPGMGIPTITATRILKGHMQNPPSPESPLSMDSFPYVALSKTYNVDRQVSDSAGTATAYLCGVKGNFGTIGVSAAARYNQCKTVAGNEVVSVLKRAQLAGKSVGIVTTTRVQHASPAGNYAHLVNRDWYSDASLPQSALEEGCKDIALQLIENVDLTVVLGGGRRYMTPQGTPDPEYPTQNSANGVRKDNRNLIEEWLRASPGNKYVWNRIELLKAVSDRSVHRLMGLFEPSDMKYELNRDNSTDPSLAEMTEVAIKLLSSNPKGFYLFVEDKSWVPARMSEAFFSGSSHCPELPKRLEEEPIAEKGFFWEGIDHGHHDGIAKRALTEAIEFDKAIERAGELTLEDDTLTVVTADHSHVFSFGGYTFRGTSIFGLAAGKARDDKSYTSIVYGNGPGYQITDKGRPDVTAEESENDTYHQQAAVPLLSETHGGEDVAIMAKGPMAHLFHGVQEQSYIAHVMAYAGGLEPYKLRNYPGSLSAAAPKASLAGLSLVPLLLWIC